MEENTQLPVEVVEQIKTNAALRCDRNEGKDDNSFRNGFDIFGLIDAGLAIDAKTINS